MPSDRYAISSSDWYERRALTGASATTAAREVLDKQRRRASIEYLSRKLIDIPFLDFVRTPVR